MTTVDLSWKLRAKKAEHAAKKLAQALKEFLDSRQKGACAHGEESWYCDGCKYEWEKRISAAYKTAESLLSDPAVKGVIND